MAPYPCPRDKADFHRYSRPRAHFHRDKPVISGAEFVTPHSSSCSPRQDAPGGGAGAWVALLEGGGALSVDSGRRGPGSRDHASSSNPQPLQVALDGPAACKKRTRPSLASRRRQRRGRGSWGGGTHEAVRIFLPFCFRSVFAFLRSGFLLHRLKKSGRRHGCGEFRWRTARPRVGGARELHGGQREWCRKSISPCVPHPVNFHAPAELCGRMSGT